MIVRRPCYRLTHTLFHGLKGIAFCVPLGYREHYLHLQLQQQFPQQLVLSPSVAWISQWWKPLKIQEAESTEQKKKHMKHFSPVDLFVYEYYPQWVPLDLGRGESNFFQGTTTNHIRAVFLQYKWSTLSLSLFMINPACRIAHWTFHTVPGPPCWHLARALRSRPGHPSLVLQVRVRPSTASQPLSQDHPPFTHKALAT